MVQWSSIAAVMVSLAAAYGCSGDAASNSNTAAGAAGTDTGAGGSAGSASGGAAGHAGATTGKAGAAANGGEAGTSTATGGASGGEAGADTAGEAGAETGGTSSGGAATGGSAGNAGSGGHAGTIGGAGGTTGGAGGAAGGTGGATGGAGGATGGTGGTGGATGGAGGAAGGTGGATTCFVPYGCTAYACNAVTGAGTVTVTGAVATAGPREGGSSNGGSGGASGAGGANEAYSFGTSDDLVGSDPNLPLGATPRTLSLWVQPVPVAGASQTLFNYGSFVTHERFGVLSSSSHNYFVGENDDVVGKTVLDDGPWHHLAVVYDGANIDMYVDGALDSSTPLGSVLDTVGTGFAIGHTVTSPGREPFHGKISDIRVYDRLLSVGEVRQLATFAGANANPQALRSTTSGLVFWLPLISGPNVMQNRCAP